MLSLLDTLRQVIKETLTPRWNYGYRIPLYNHSDRLIIRVYDWNKLLPKKFLGQVRVSPLF